MANVLLDTGILIQFLRGNPKTAALLASLISISVVSVSVVTVTEILVGSRDDKHLKAARSVLSLVQPLSVDTDIAEKAAVLIQRYPQLFGKQISRGIADAFIGATAWRRNLPLYTLNTRDFTKTKITELQIHAINAADPT